MASKWSTPNSVTTIFSAADLNTMTAGTGLSSSAYNNATNADLYADFIFALMWAVAPTAGTRALEVFLLPSPDGTNYPTVASNYPQRGLIVANLETRAPSTTVLEYLATPLISIPPGSFKIHIVNVSAQALHGSDATMFGKMRPIQLVT